MIREDIVRFNPWWSEDFDIKDLKEYRWKKRTAYNKVMDFIEKSNLMVFIKGMRRLGKSTIMRQVIIDLIEKKEVNRNQIGFYQFSRNDDNIEEVLDLMPDKGYIFLDEIQYCENWRDVLKKVYDMDRFKKIIYGGSAVLEIVKEKESLLGRFLPIRVETLSFGEYLYLKYGSRKKYYFNEKEWEKYLKYGEFPGTIELETEELKKKYLKEAVLEPLLTVDINMYEVEKRREMERMIEVLAREIGQILSKKNLAEEIGITRKSIDKYLEILQDLRLIKLVENNYKSARKRILADKKIYFGSLNLALILAEINDIKSGGVQKYMGQVFENTIYNEINRNENKVYFWRRKEKELDFILRNEVGIEVKSKEKVGQLEIDKYRRYTQEATGKDNFVLIYQGKNDKERNNWLDYLFQHL